MLVFGDTHIPTRRDGIPTDFHEHIEQTQYDIALVTGDLVDEAAMRHAMPPLPPCRIVRGNMDYTNDYPLYDVLEAEGQRILLLHGTQLRPRGNIRELWEIAVNIGATIAVHGHTHKADVTLHRRKLFLNPGTISGATGGWPGKSDASFIELILDGEEIDVTLYHTDWKRTRVSEVSFRRDGDGIVRGR